MCAGVPLSSDEIIFTREMSGQNCICTGVHPSGCYDKTITTAQVNVLCEYYFCVILNLDYTGYTCLQTVVYTRVLLLLH